jgi:flagellar biosynthesis component FlhA
MTDAASSIAVVLGKALSAFADSDVTNRIAASLHDLHVGLGFPAPQVVIDLRVDPTARDTGFEVTFNGERAWGSPDATTVENPTSRRLADAIAGVLFDNRQGLVLGTAAGRADQPATVPAELLEAHARACVHACRRRSIDPATQVDEAWVEQQLWSAEALRLRLHIAAGLDDKGCFGDHAAPRPIHEVAEKVQDAVWGEDGFLIPPLQVVPDDTLEPSEFRIGINDVMFPPQQGLAKGEVWIPGIDAEGRDRANPVTGAPGRVIARPSNISGTRAVFDHLGMALLEVIRAVRRNASAFLCGELVAAELDALEHRAPELTKIARRQLGERRITAVLRQLVAERVSVVDRLEILDAMLCYEGETLVPLDRRVVIHAEPGAWSVTSAPARTGSDRGIIEAVRNRLSPRIRRQQATGYGDIHAIVMDPRWEARLARPERLDATEHGKLIAALCKALGYTHSIGPVVLTDTIVRRALRDEIALAFPDLGVLAFSELDPRTPPRVLTRVLWSD